MASEDEIAQAIKKADANTLIYTGYSVFNAQDAAMLRRINPNKKAKPFYWIATLIATAAVVGVVVYSGIL